MNKTINAQDVQPGMTISEKHGGITQTFTVDSVEQQEASVILRTAENDAVPLRHFKEVTVLAETEPDVGSVIMDADNVTWVRVDDTDMGWRCAYRMEVSDNVPPLYKTWEEHTSRGNVKVLYRNTYTPPHTSNTQENKVPDTVQEKDWQSDNVEWRKHDWADADGDVWKWYEGVQGWRVVRANGETRYESGPGLGLAEFPVTRVK